MLPMIPSPGRYRGGTKSDCSLVYYGALVDKLPLKPVGLNGRCCGVIQDEDMATGATHQTAVVSLVPAQKGAGG